MRELFAIIIAVLFLLSCIEIFTDRLSKGNKKHFFLYCIIGFFLLVFVGFRPVGSDKDSIMYYKYFNTFCDYTYTQIFLDNPHRVREVGYILLNKIFCKVGFREVLVIIAILSIVPKLYLLYRYSLYPFLALFIYASCFYILRDFTQIRDALATSFILFSVMMLWHHRYIWGLVLLLLGSLFHFVSLFFIPIIIFATFVDKLKYYYILLVISVSFLFIDIDRILRNISLPEQLGKYNQIQGGGSFSIVVFLIFIAGMHWIGKKNEYSNFLYKYVILGIVSGMLFYHHAVLFRVVNILAFFAILLYCNTIRNINFRYKLGISIIGMILALYICENNFIALIND